MEIKDLSGMRKDYVSEDFSEKSLLTDPYLQFDKWFAEASLVEEFEANAMVLSTSGSDNRPSSRVVLLKKYSKDGFVFFTNYLSRKGREIDENPWCSLLFFWPHRVRQVRVEGVAEKIVYEDSLEYFKSRPVISQASSSLSHQSSILEDKERFDKMIESLVSSGEDIKMPPHWGGYIVKPERFEFWQGGTGRSHDRFRYDLEEDHSWRISRLYP